MQNRRGPRVSTTFLILFIYLIVLGNSLVFINSSSDSRVSESDVESMFKNSSSKQSKLGPLGSSLGISIYI